MKTALENMKDKYEDENLSFHMCNKLFRSKQMKDNHLKTQHGNNSNKGFTCDECDRLFQSKTALDYHKGVTHVSNVEVKHMCAVCQKRFLTKHSVNAHTRTVHNRRSFFCRKCFFNFKLHSHLVRHYKTVHDIELRKYYHENADSTTNFYRCTVCDFKTVYKQNLGLHMESAHSIQKLTFKCEKCGSNFTQKRVS